jgi:hypothetical protein
MRMSKKKIIKKKKKFKRRFNPKLIKIHANYTTQDIADLFHVHIDTVNSWYRSGLKRIDQERPFLVFGRDLVDFLTRRNKKMKKKTCPDEFFCCKCKEPRKTKGGIVELRIINSKKLMIKGICEICGTKMNKLGSIKKINEIKKMFNVQAIQEERLLDCNSSSVIPNENEE